MSRADDIVLAVKLRFPIGFKCLLTFPQIATVLDETGVH